MRTALVLLALVGLGVGCTLHMTPEEESSSSSASAIAKDATTIGMPFDGYFDRFGVSPPGGKDRHHIIYGAEWATDIYAPPGTAVVFHSSAARARVTNVSGTCAKGGPDAGGYTASIELQSASGEKIGVAHYLHLSKPRVKKGDAITEGTVLGDTRLWPYSACYQVSNNDGVHVHFEAAGASCWAPDSKARVNEGDLLARLGSSSPNQRCTSSSAPPPPPFNATPRPTGGPFQAARIASPVSAGAFLTQCSEDQSGERVWTTTASGPDRNERWAEASYPQHIGASCGRVKDKIYPLVFRSHAPGAIGGFVGVCLEDNAGTELVFHVDSEIVDGHPAASFLYPQISPNCP